MAIFKTLWQNGEISPNLITLYPGLFFVYCVPFHFTIQMYIEKGADVVPRIQTQGPLDCRC